jgi:hypothetical protein
VSADRYISAELGMDSMASSCVVEASIHQNDTSGSDGNGVDWTDCLEIWVSVAST